MYQDFFGFRELPFELTPNPRFLFLTTRHREALANLRHGISTAKGIAVLTGEAGTGKTTIVRAALDAESAQTGCLYLNNPTLTRNEFVEFLAKGFQLSAEAARSKTALLVELETLLKSERAAGRVHALVVDEAQSLPHELLEEIRLLANFETETEKLLPVVLAGQPELAARLDETSLRQLKQRIALRCELAPLTLQETASYIAARIRTAGGDSARVFTREAVILIHDHSRGIPRTISVLCDNSLVSGFALERRPVGKEVVLEVCRDFHVTPSAKAAAAAPVATAQPEAPASAPVLAPEHVPPKAPSAAAKPKLTPAISRDASNESHAPKKRFSFFGN
jgi:general secretion pathway protein A